MARSGSRINVSDAGKALVHDGFGVWCAARRLNAGHFAWPHDATVALLSLTHSQFDLLITGLRWQRLSAMSVITRL
jgi:transposase